MSTGTANYTNIQGGSQNQNYMWTNGTLTLTVPQPQNLTAGNWTSTVTDALTGCLITNTFFIAEPPPIQLFYSTSAQSVCVTQTVLLNCNAIGGTSPYTFLWSGGGVGNGVVSTENTVGTHVYTLLTIDANTCTASATLAVQVLSNPTVWASPLYICPFETGTFTANGASNYTWMPGGFTGSTCAVNPTVTTIYTLTGEFSGCLGAATTTLNIKPLPIASISMTNSVCEMQNILLTAAGGTAYIWSGPANFQSNLSNPGIAQIQLNQSGVYQVTVTGVNGCTASVASSLNVIALPFITASGSTVCSTQSLQLSSTSSLPGSQFVWTGPLNFYYNGAAVNWPNANANNSGAYTVCITSPQGCSVNAVVQASIVNQPSVTLNTNAPLCENSPLQLTANSVPGTTYIWSGPNGFNASGPYQTINAISLNAQGVYQLQSNYGPCTFVQTHNVLVYPLPQIQIISNQPVCEQHLLQLTATSTATGLIQYQWSGPFNYQASGQTALRDSCTAMASGNYQVWVTDLHGCVGYKQSLIQIQPNPTVACTSLSNCINKYSTLEASGATSYTWYAPLAILGNQYTVAIPPIYQMQAHSYTVVGSALNGCTAQAVGWVYPKAIPQPSILPSSSLACLGDSLLFVASGGQKYEWRGPDGFIMSGNPISYPVLNTKMAGIYTLTAYDAQGCSNTRIHEMQLTLAAQAYFTSTASRSCTPYCNSITLVPNAYNTATLVSIAWNSALDLQGAGSYKKTICFTKPGFYTVNCTIKDEHNCKSTVSAQFTADAGPSSDFTTSPIFIQSTQPAFTLQPSEDVSFYYWTLALPQGNLNSTDKNPVIPMPEPGCYPMVLKVNKGSCSSVTHKELCIQDAFHFYIPDVFTPNNDGLNDVFKPTGNQPFRYQMQIFDRWGLLRFESDSVLEGWNGTFNQLVCEEGYYVYKIKISTPQQELIYKTGSVLLMR